MKVFVYVLTRDEYYGDEFITSIVAVYKNKSDAEARLASERNKKWNGPGTFMYDLEEVEMI